MTKLLMPWVLVVCWLCAVSEGRAQVIQASAAAPVAQQFIVGDWYDVSIRRADVTDKISGMLLEINDDWIVLATVTRNAYEVHKGTPVLKYLPYIGSSFRWKITQVDIFKEYRWVPRDGVQIDRHSKEVAPDVKTTFQGHPPVFGETLTAHYLRDGKPQRFSASPQASNTEDALRQILKIVPKTDLLLVQSQIPMTPKEIKASSAK